MLRKTRKNVGVIGLGIIGSRVVAALRASGFNVFVWNRTPRTVPNFLGSAAGVAELCETIQIFVSDGPALHEVIGSMELGPRHTVICCATVGPEAVLEAAEMVASRGARFLDAPFTGSKGAAENRALTYYIGGEDSVLGEVEPVLRASSKAIVKIGGIGQASVLKLVTNMLVASTVQTLAEALAITVRSGIDGAMLSAALEHHAVRSGLTDLKLPHMLAEDYSPHFSIKHLFKDVQLALRVANQLGIHIPSTSAAGNALHGALNRGLGELDVAALVQAFELQSAAEGEDRTNQSDPTDSKPL